MSNQHPTNSRSQHSNPEHDRPRHAHYDAVVVGARAAGAATAMLLAEQGLTVLAVDRQAYGSDTLSTHALMRGAVARLARWGLLDRVLAAGAPVITGTTFTYGDETIHLDIKAKPGLPGLVAPRRTVLDAILVDGAREAGAEVIHNTRVTGLRTDATGRVVGADLMLSDGSDCSVSSAIVIGADGLRSSVARTVGAPITHEGTHFSAYTATYYSGADVDPHSFRWIYRPGLGAGVIPTTGDAVCVFSAMEPDRFAAHGRQDVAATHTTNLEALDPELNETLAAATPLGRVRSWPGVTGRFRKPVGPGWALVGDAGYFKDPFAAHGITDAFRDAELLTDAIVCGDLDGYETRRDELSMPLFGVLDRIASYDWDLETLKGLHYQLSKAMKAEDEATLNRARATTLQLAA